MKKNNIAVEITTKNKSKILDILLTFNERRYSEFTLTHKYIVYNSSGNYWMASSNNTNSLITISSPKKLKNILAKEHLKEGDVILASIGSDKYLVEFKEVSNRNTGAWIIANRYITFSKDGSTSEIFKTGAFINFLRYATEEEKALLEPKKELEVGKWYTIAYNNNPKEVVSINFVEQIEGDKVWYSYGIDLKNNEWKNKDWYNSRHTSVEATQQEVEEALIKEAKRRGYNYDNYIFDESNNILWGNDIDDDGRVEKVLLSNGLWAKIREDRFSELKEAHKNGAEIEYRHKGVYRSSWMLNDNPAWSNNYEYRIKPETKPKKGDVCKFWMEFEEDFNISELIQITNSILPYKNKSGSWHKNTKVLTPEEVTELLFKKS